MSKRLKKSISLFLSIVFVLSLLATPVFAAKGNGGGGKGAGGGAGAGGGGAEKTGTLEGQVVLLGSTSGIAGAKITATGASGSKSVITDSNGNYRLDLTAGSYTLLCETNDYGEVTSEANIQKGRTTTLNFEFSNQEKSKGEITGKITDSVTKTGISGATIKVNNTNLTATTDAMGSYVIPEVPIGSYRLTAVADNYNKAEMEAEVSDGQAVRCDFSLSPVSAGNSVVILSLDASSNSVREGEQSTITLSAEIDGTTKDFKWIQIGGPKVPINSLSAEQAVIDLSNLAIAVDVELTFRLTVTGTNGKTSSKDVKVAVEAVDMFPFLGKNAQIGGSSTAVQKFSVNGDEWAIFNIGSKLCTTPIGTTPEPVNSINVPGFVQDIDVVTYNGIIYALLSTGSEGIVVVDISDPVHMKQVSHVHINYFQDGITCAEGSGVLLYDVEISSIKAPVTALETDGINLFIADYEYGIHRTALANLLRAAGPELEEDGTLKIDTETFTLQYAGENPWGGPLDLKLYRGKLFACLGSLGIGIFDTATLKQVGRYNLYTDPSVSEDWFIDMDVKEIVQKDPVTGAPFVDEHTGLPDYRQTSFEFLQVMKGDSTAPTPWADFDRYGKYYYQAQGIDIAEFGGRTIAYIAYSLGGLVAVDITGYQDANENNFLNAKYLGYVPAVPANGPEKIRKSRSQSLLPYYGAGMLKEAGVVDVQVQGNLVYASDHFAGLMIIDNAATPDLHWKGANYPYKNDIDGVVGNHFPDYEFITSYDMSPWDSSDHESLPKWMYESPCLLATAEINGHAGSLLLMDDMSLDTAGNIDLLQCAGAGGFNFIDIIDLNAPSMSRRYSVPVYCPPTKEIGAAVDGSATETIAIGHTEGIAASDSYLYVADGPHGISAWRIVDENGFPTDDVHLVANTLQDEYPKIENGVKIYPATHAKNVVFDPVNNVAWSCCSSLGLRRVDVSKVEAGLGTVGKPILLPLALTDCFEHNAEWGTVKELQYQDHAYAVKIKGKYAFVADGANGLTVYDYTKNPTRQGFVVSNIGAGKERPPLGVAQGLDLWEDPATGNSYAVVAAGPRGIGVVNITDVKNMQLVKVFEPIKYEDGKVGHADGKSVDVNIVGDKAYVSYDSFGLVCYNMSDLIAPLPAGLDPTDTWKKSNSGQIVYDYRPEAVARFVLKEVPGYEGWGGGAVRLTHTKVQGKLTFYVAYGDVGILKIDWTNPANPVLKEIAPTVGTCEGITISNGRLYAADHQGGLVFFN